MNRLPVPCFGVGCPRHLDCYRYLLVEGSNPKEVRMSHCGPKAGEGSATLWPLFQSIPPRQEVVAGDRRGGAALPNGRRTT